MKIIVVMGRDCYKPHIKKISGYWVCEGIGYLDSRVSYAGSATTPIGAWYRWIELLERDRMFGRQNNGRFPFKLQSIVHPNTKPYLSQIRKQWGFEN